jgi:hypothetical protein
LASSELSEQVEHFRRVMMGQNSSNPQDSGEHRHRVIGRVLHGLAIFLLIQVGFYFNSFIFGEVYQV